MKISHTLVILILLSFICSYASPVPTTIVNEQYIYQQKTVPVYHYEIVNIYPHSIEAFTQGLTMNNGYLYEGTGLYGASYLQKIDLVSGKVLLSHKLNQIYFGEGITIIGNNIYQLTYQSNIGFVYDKQTFHVLKTFYYPTEGWGLTHDNKDLIMSDGTATLFFIDPNNLKIARSIQVHDSKIAVSFLNELEYIHGIIYANIWQTMIIAMINPTNGEIIGWIDMSGINPNPNIYKSPYVLNGIAYDPLTKEILITGKNWPSIFGIHLVKQ